MTIGANHHSPLPLEPRNAHIIGHRVAMIESSRGFQPTGVVVPLRTRRVGTFDFPELRGISFVATRRMVGITPFYRP